MRRMWPVTLRRTVTASIRPSPLGEKNGELTDAALMTGGTLSVKTHSSQGDTVTLTLRSGGQVTCDKALIDNNMPEGSAVPLVVTANFINAGVQKQLLSTANVRVIK